MNLIKNPNNKACVLINACYPNKFVNSLNLGISYP